MTKCLICEKGMLKKVKEKYVMFGVDLGTYPAEKCTVCGEVFNDAAVMDQLEAAAKRKGIWGMSKKTKVTRSGNSLAVRIPKEVADFLHLKEGQDVSLHPDDKKLVIEPS